MRNFVIFRVRGCCIQLFFIDVQEVCHKQGPLNTGVAMISVVRYLCENCGKELGKCLSETCDCGGVEGMCYKMGIEHKVTDYDRAA